MQLGVFYLVYCQLKHSPMIYFFIYLTSIFLSVTCCYCLLLFLCASLRKDCISHCVVEDSNEISLSLLEAELTLLFLSFPVCQVFQCPTFAEPIAGVANVFSPSGISSWVHYSMCNLLSDKLQRIITSLTCWPHY